MIWLTAWLGTAEDCEALRQFSRDYAWETRIDDPEYAADEVLSELEGPFAEDARSRLRAAIGGGAAAECIVRRVS